MKTKRLHDQESFFKYVPASTAQIIIKNCTLRWSYSGIFNDPFDIPENIIEEINPINIGQALRDRIKALMLEPSLNDYERFNSDFRLLAIAAMEADEVTRSKMITALEEEPEKFITDSPAIDELRNMWKSMHKNQRIICLSEVWDSSSMWNHYSDEHRGAVIEFSCNEESDSPWLIAKPINYTNEPISVGTPEGFVEALISNPIHFAERIMYEYKHTKTLDWAYEKEWRIASSKRPNESGEFSDYKFAPEDLSGIILGMKMEEDSKEELISDIETKYPHAKIWESYIQGGRSLKRKQIK